MIIIVFMMMKISLLYSGMPQNIEPKIQAVFQDRCWDDRIITLWHGRHILAHHYIVGVFSSKREVLTSVQEDLCTRTGRIEGMKLSWLAHCHLEAKSGHILAWTSWYLQMTRSCHVSICMPFTGCKSSWISSIKVGMANRSSTRGQNENFGVVTKNCADPLMYQSLCKHTDGWKRDVVNAQESYLQVPSGESYCQVPSEESYLQVPLSGLDFCPSKWFMWPHTYGLVVQISVCRWWNDLMQTHKCHTKRMDETSNARASYLYAPSPHWIVFPSPKNPRLLPRRSSFANLSWRLYPPVADNVTTSWHDVIFDQETNNFHVVNQHTPTDPLR